MNDKQTIAVSTFKSFWQAKQTDEYKNGDLTIKVVVPSKTMTQKLPKNIVQ